MPKQIDLEPVEFRGKPERGQPVFKRGGLTRLAVYVAAVAFALIVGAIMKPIADLLIAVIWPV
jgi:hypothetical protein